MLHIHRILVTTGRLHPRYRETYYGALPLSTLNLTKGFESYLDWQLSSAESLVLSIAFFILFISVLVLRYWLVNNYFHRFDSMRRDNANTTVAGMVKHTKPINKKD